MNLVSFKSLFSPKPLEKPVVVEMLPLDEPAKDKPRELDLPPTPEEERVTPAKRLGPQDHVAKKEVAPKGDAPEDRVRAVPQPKPVPKAAPKETIVKTEPLKKPKPADLPKPKEEVVERPLPDIKSLLELPQATVARIDRETRRKEREGVEEGDIVWLDTEKDILISFFRRFRDNIYRVWNYPPASVKRGEQGICRLEITVDRTGRVRNTNVLMSSGFPDLDREARKAVWTGSPYGPLPSDFKKDQLHIIANFQYELTGKSISRWGYSRRR
jgi:protein TonB